MAATSANISEEKPALNAKEVKINLPQISYILPGRVKLGKVSKVIDVTGKVNILRR